MPQEQHELEAKSERLADDESRKDMQREEKCQGIYYGRKDHNGGFFREGKYNKCNYGFFNNLLNKTGLQTQDECKNRVYKQFLKCLKKGS